MFHKFIRKTKPKPTRLDQLIGRRFAMHRKRAGLSQEEAGLAIGVSHQQVQKYESGVNRLSAARLWLASKALGVPVQKFYPPTRGRNE